MMEKYRYLAAGLINTAFGFAVALGLYQIFSRVAHVVLISALANIVNITFSFVIHKFFVFKSTGRWLNEYLRAYVSYGFGAILGTMMTWVLVDFFTVNFALSQLIVIGVNFALTYLLHKKFTFKMADHE